MKIISNKDGSHPRHTGDFTTYSPNTYAIVDGGEEVGSVIQVPNFPLSTLNPAWIGTDKVWLAIIDGRRVAASQRLSEVREAIK